MANEIKVPIWSALQTNRSGLDTDKVGLSTVGETLGACKAADIVISVGRDPEEQITNPLAAKIGILKNRNGSAGFYLDATVDPSKLFIEIVQLSPSDIGIKKKSTTNKKPEKKEKTLEEEEASANNFPLTG